MTRSANGKAADDHLNAPLWITFRIGGSILSGLLEDIAELMGLLCRSLQPVNVEVILNVCVIVIMIVIVKKNLLIVIMDNHHL